MVQCGSDSRERPAYCGVVQLVVHRPHKPEVAGSSPAPATGKTTKYARAGVRPVFC